jgi:hypothetical protein
MKSWLGVYRDRGLRHMPVLVADLAGGGCRVFSYHLLEVPIPLFRCELWRESR